MPRKLEVLVVDDNEPDARWFGIVMQDLGFPHHVSIVNNGEDALHFLSKTGDFAGAPDPDIAFIDMKLPRIEGPALINRIRRDSRHENLPICALTGSPQQRDSAAGQPGLDLPCYIVKPITPEAFLGSLKQFETLRPFLDKWGQQGSGN